ncbi:tape measure protein [Pseudomonas nitroreducens]|uniref:Tape measure protein n=1 Tax=Pseudomonas nitroreducens TaxID=46680 RepID=A0ABS0KRU7_PSENT|nr:tape measure protein [Pseudomonas nitroreducens]MBG6290794.1 tape measure protein [Pseudomonas nitroreducens]
MTEVELRLTADDAEARRAVSGFRAEYQKLVKDVERPLKQVSAFRDLESQLDSGARTMQRARDKVRELGNEIARAEAPSKTLQASYKASVADLQRLERVEAQQIVRLAGMRAELQAAGVDTRNLATEQAKLRAEFSQRLAGGRADAALTQARDSLGVGNIKETQLALVQLRQQYQLLVQSGDLSSKELAEAQASYRRSVDATLAKLRQLRTAIAAPASKESLAVQGDLASSFRGLSNARDALGVSAIKEAQRALVDLRGQYQLLRDSGMLSSRDLALAQANYKASVERSLARLRELRAATQQPVAPPPPVIDRITPALQNLGVERLRALQAQLRSLPADYERLSRAGFKSATEQAAAQQQLQRRVEETRREIQELTVASQGTGRLQGLINGAAGLGVGLGVTEAIGAYIKAADQVKNLQSRLRLATNDQEEFNTAQRELGRLANENQAPISSLYSLYTRLAPSLTELKRGQKDLLGVIEAVSASTRISGASAEEADASIIQFAQALGAGALRGDEFNSVAEQTPRLMRALADGLGVARGALKQMANDGQLTANVVINALLKQLPKLRAEAAALEKTTGGQFQVLANEATQAVGSIDDLTGQTKALATGLGLVSRGLKVIGDSFKAFNKGGFGALFEFDRQSTQDSAIAEVEKSIARVMAAKKELQDNGNLSILNFLRFGAADMAELDRQQAKYEEYLNNLKEAREKAENDAKQKRLAKTEAEEAKDRERNYQDQLRALDGFAGSERALQAAREAGERGFQDRIDRARQSGLAKLKGYLNQQYQELKKAQANYEQVVGETETILKPFKDLTQAFKDGTAGPAADPSYTQVQDLKLKARSRIDSDPQKAIEYANKAREALEQLLSAGTNTYGLQGVAQELEDIATAAQEVRKVRAADIQTSVQDSITSLVKQAEALKNLSVVVSWDQANEEQIKARMLALSQQIAEQLKFQVQVTAPDVDSNVARVTADKSAAPPAFATGGILRGPGTGTSDSLLVRASAGEGFINARAVSYYGPDLIHAINRLGLPRFATGGVLGPVPIPSIPAASPSLSSAAPGAGASGLAPLTLVIGDRQYSMMAPPDTTKQIRREALKGGHRRQ